jgi:hypothetical protein
VLENLAALKRRFEGQFAQHFVVHLHVERAQMLPALAVGLCRYFKNVADARCGCCLMQGANVPLLLHGGKARIPAQRQEDFAHELRAIGRWDENGTFSHWACS